MDVAQSMAVESGLLTRDPARLACPSGDLAVKAHRELGADKGTPCHAVLDVELVEAHRALFMQSDERLHTSSLETGDPSPPHAIVGVLHGDDDSRDPRQYDRLGTRRGPVRVTAGLEIHV